MLHSYLLSEQIDIFYNQPFRSCFYEFQVMAILQNLYSTLLDRLQSFENLQLAWLVKSSFHI